MMSIQAFIEFLKQQYHKYTNSRATKHLISRANSNSDKDALTVQEKSEAKEYWKKYTDISLAFHNYYKNKTGVFYRDYIPEDIYYTKIDPHFNNIAEANYLDNKCYYGWIFHGIPMPMTICKRMNGIWLLGEDEVVSIERLDAIVSKEKSLFVKAATNSYGGAGVYYVSGEQGNIFEALLKVIDDMHGDIIVQKPLSQHADLARVNESSVNTIRVLSLLNRDGTVDVFSVVLRMGISGAKVDNASKGGITCGVSEDGRCKEHGYYSYVNSGKCLTEHPTSKVKFSDIAIPSFEELIATVKKAHAKIPHFRLVSWDMAVDSDGVPNLIEANLFNGEVDFHQLNNGPLFKDKTEAILDEVYGISSQ